jgi:hypothetical protein
MPKAGESEQIGLARERGWRNHCVSSVDIASKARQGVELVRDFVPQIEFRFIAAPAHRLYRSYTTTMLA